MNSLLAPVWANFYVEYFKQKALSAAQLKLVHWFSYVDDTITFLTSGKNELERIQKPLNTHLLINQIHHGNWRRQLITIWWCTGKTEASWLAGACGLQKTYTHISIEPCQLPPSYIRNTCSFHLPTSPWCLWFWKPWWRNTTSQEDFQTKSYSTADIH